MSTLIAGNLLGLNRQSLDTDLTGWGNGDNATISRDTSVFKVTPASLRLTTTAAVSFCNFTGGYPTANVTAGTTLTVRASVRAATTARTATVLLVWIDAANGFLSAETIALGTSGAGAFADLSTTTFVPEGAAKVEVRFGTQGALASGEVFQFDEMSVGTANQPPTVTAGDALSVTTGTTVTLTGSGVDPEGGEVTLVWSQDSGPAVTLGGSGGTRTALLTTAGTYVFRLIGTDPDGLTGTATRTITATTPTAGGSGVFAAVGGAFVPLDLYIGSTS